MTSADLKLPISIEELRSILNEYGVVSASLFGSYARGDAKPDSDLDILVTLESGRSLFDLGGLQYALEEATKRNVDIATKLHPRFEPYITPELVEIYAKTT